MCQHCNPIIIVHYCPLVAYVRLHTNLGDLNVELHSDQVNCSVLCVCVHVCMWDILKGMVSQLRVVWGVTCSIIRDFIFQYWCVKRYQQCF